MSASVVSQSRELRIFVKDADGRPLSGVHIILVMDDSPIASAQDSHGQAEFKWDGGPQNVGVLAVYKQLSKHALLGPETNNYTLHFEEVHLMKQQDRWGVLVGLGLWAAAMLFAFAFQKPNALQETLIRATFSLGAGGIATVIPGMLNIKIGTGKRLTIAAAGALAVFLLTFVAVPGKNPIF